MTLRFLASFLSLSFGAAHAQSDVSNKITKGKDSVVHFYTPAESVGADVLWDKGYQGDSLYTGIWEAGKDVSISCELPDLQDRLGGNRVRVKQGSNTTNHANTVGRIIGSDGTLANVEKGVAPKSLLLSYTAAGDEFWTEMDAAAYPNGTTNSILVANHSFAASAGWHPSTLNTPSWVGVFEISEVEDYKFGRYSAEVFIRDDVYDETIYNNPFLSIVKAAGNDRGQSGLLPYKQWSRIDSVWSIISGTLLSPNKPIIDGGEQGFDCIPNGATGKNSITVGVCNPLTAPFSNKSQIKIGANSGFGPTDDGRIKPDLVAPHSSLKTSYSTPVVTGVILLLQEMYKDLIGPDYMKASTVKALLCHTAFEAGKDGPDYKSGWGMVNAAGAGSIIENNSRNILEDSIENNDSNLYFYYVPNSSAETKVTLTWTDIKGTALTLSYTPADVNTSTLMLVNDLDLRIVKLSDSTEFEPYTLDPSNPAKTATRGDNFRDNIEQVYQDSTEAGWYAIRVNHKSNLQSGVKQDFSLIIEGFETLNLNVFWR